MSDLPKRRRVLHKIKLTEISAVDRPCQEGAKMVIMKRASSVDSLRFRVLKARLILAERELAKFDPDQPRDDSGKWTSTGEGAAAAPETKFGKIVRNAKTVMRVTGKTAKVLLYTIYGSIYAGAIGSLVAALVKSKLDERRMKRPGFAGTGYKGWRDPHTGKPKFDLGRTEYRDETSRNPLVVRKALDLGDLSDAEAEQILDQVLKKASAADFAKIVAILNKEAPVAKFDPDQLRDDYGRWSESGSSISDQVHGTGASGKSKFRRFISNVGRGAKTALAVLGLVVVAAATLPFVSDIVENKLKKAKFSKPPEFKSHFPERERKPTSVPSVGQRGTATERMVEDIGKHPKTIIGIRRVAGVYKKGDLGLTEEQARRVLAQISAALTEEQATALMAKLNGKIAA